MTDPNTSWAAPEGSPQGQPQPDGRPQPQGNLQAPQGQQAAPQGQQAAPQGQPQSQLQQPYQPGLDPQAAYAPAPVAVAPASSPIVAPKKKGGGLVNAVLVIAALIAVGGVTFAVGRATAPASASGFRNGQGFPAGFPGGSFDPSQGGPAGFPGGSFDPSQGGPAGFPGGFGDRTMTISGTVKSIDGTTMVITTSSGIETTIDTSGAAYHAQAAATASDVSVGSTVSVATQGFGGRRPDASAAPAASGVPAPGSTSVTATDVTITSGR